MSCIAYEAIELQYRLRRLPLILGGMAACLNELPDQSCRMRVHVCQSHILQPRHPHNQPSTHNQKHQPVSSAPCKLHHNSSHEASLSPKKTAIYKSPGHRWHHSHAHASCTRTYCQSSQHTTQPRNTDMHPVLPSNCHQPTNRSMYQSINQSTPPVKYTLHATLLSNTTTMLCSAHPKHLCTRLADDKANRNPTSKPPPPGHTINSTNHPPPRQSPA